MGQYMVKVYPTVQCWVQNMGGGPNDYFQPDEDGNWEDLDGLCYFGGEPGAKELTSFGGWAIQGVQFAKSWSRNDLWPGPIAAIVGGSLIEYTSEVKFVIPATPVGMTLNYAKWVETYGSSPSITVFGDIIPGATYTYIPDWRVSTEGSDWHHLMNPDWPSHDIHGDYAATATPPLIGINYMEIWYDYDVVDPCDAGEVYKSETMQFYFGNTFYPDALWQYGKEGDEVGDTVESGELITTLEYNTLYWFKMVTYCTTKVFWFRTPPDDEDEEEEFVWSLSAYPIGDTYAQLNCRHQGSVSRRCGIWINSGKYGRTQWDGHLTNGHYSIVVSGLSPSTTYVFHAIAESASGYLYGINIAFTTLSVGGTPTRSYTTRVLDYKGRPIYLAKCEAVDSITGELYDTQYTDNGLATFDSLPGDRPVDVIRTWGWMGRNITTEYNVYSAIGTVIDNMPTNSHIQNTDSYNNGLRNSDDVTRPDYENVGSWYNDIVTGRPYICVGD